MFFAARLLALPVSRPTASITAFARQFHQTFVRTAHYNNANLEVFNQVAIKGSSNKVVLVDFYADWCKPCHALRPILERLTGPSSQVDLVTVDTESEDGFKLLSKYQVRAMPTVVAFKNGAEVKRFVGVLPEHQVQEFIESL